MRKSRTRQTRVISVVIASGVALSGEIDLEGYGLMGIIMPGTWTTAGLSFEVSEASGGTFVDLFDDSNAEVVVAAIQAKAHGVELWQAALAPWRYIKFRSGTTGTPVNQVAERTIQLVLKA